MITDITTQEGFKASRTEEAYQTYLAKAAGYLNISVAEYEKKHIEACERTGNEYV